MNSLILRFALFENYSLLLLNVLFIGGRSWRAARPERDRSQQLDRVAGSDGGHGVCLRLQHHLSVVQLTGQRGQCRPVLPGVDLGVSLFYLELIWVSVCFTWR